MPQDFYAAGAGEEETPKPETMRPQAPVGTNKVAWMIGIGLAAFVGLPILIGSVTDLVKAAKE